MAAISIEVGRTSTKDIRYVGIQPPLDTKSGRYQAVTAALGEDAVNLGFKVRVSDEGEIYTIGTHLNTAGDVDNEIIGTAYKIAETLRGLGDVASVDERLYDISGGGHFFASSNSQPRR